MVRPCSGWRRTSRDRGGPNRARHAWMPARCYSSSAARPKSDKVARQRRGEAAEKAGQGGDLLLGPAIAEDGYGLAVERGARLGDALVASLGQHDIAHAGIARVGFAFHETQ